MTQLQKYLSIACLAAGLAFVPAAAYAEDAAPVAAEPVQSEKAGHGRHHKKGDGEGHYKRPDFDSPDFNKEEFCTKVKARHAERKAKMEEKKAAYEELKAKDPEAAEKMKQAWQEKREKMKAKYGEKGKGEKGGAHNGKREKAEKIRELCGLEPLKSKRGDKAPKEQKTAE